MVFSSLTFLFVFLPIVISIYFAAPSKFKNLVLFISSLIFYAWGEPVYILLMIFSTIVDYINGILVDKYSHDKNKSKKFVIISVIINLSLLCIFKYADFIILTINGFIGTDIPLLKLPLPIGISFYTFQTMSYTIDVYRKEAPVQRNIISLGAYVSLFPQLIAGPIVRYQTIAEQINTRKETLDKFGEGVSRFLIGLGKKVLIANNIGMLWNIIQSSSINNLSVLSLWFGISAFSLQIYFDFSGYSDMAIGLGKMFGFDFLENFNYPYISQSITEFWRRWHISLGSWFKDYVYIPLGGNKKGKFKTYRNLFIVWFLTGLWHGASWNFVIWGLYFGVIITLEKIFLINILKKAPKFFRHLYTTLILFISWVFFNFEEMSEGIEYLKGMFGFKELPIIDVNFLYYLTNYAVVFIVGIICATPIAKKFIKNKTIYALILFVIYFLSIAYLVDSSFNPFLYFRF